MVVERPDVDRRGRLAVDAPVGCRCILFCAIGGEFLEEGYERKEVGA